MDQPSRDGFEGLGFLVQLLIPIAGVAFVFPLVVIWLKLRNANGTAGLRGGYIWAFMLAYCLSLLSAWWFIPLSLTDKIVPTAIFASIGTVLAVLSLVLAIRSQGSGRGSAVAAAIFLTILWLPFFYGRVLLRL